MISAVSGICVVLYGIGAWAFIQWFKNQTKDFVNKSEFDALKTVVTKLETDMAIGFQKLQSNQETMLEKLKHSHEYMSRELKHMADDSKQNKNHDTALRSLIDFMDRLERKHDK
jgi:hypothetical protein